MTEAEKYVAQMSDEDLTDMLNDDLRRATGRCVSHPVMRAAHAEHERRIRDATGDE